MITQNLNKLKKYLFLISILFLFTSLSHLIYTYLYENSEIVPVKWGTISEWLVWNFPSLNPVKNLSWNNKYIINLLYRSLLKYDLNENKIVWDIANCDISSLINIECYINDNAKWSNGEEITAEDIVSTYELIRDTNSNVVISSLLKDTKIEHKENVITFKNNKKDVNFLNIFFQPIISKEVIDNLSEENIYGNFPTTNWIYSWDFKISNISSDLSLGVSKIILDRNENNKDWNISKIILNIFPNINTFLKNKQSVNIFNDNDNIVWRSIPRLESNKYTLPQFVWLFINQNNITDKNLRNFILNKINSKNLVELLGEDNFSEIKNPYLLEESTNKELEVKNFDSIMQSLWYSKKSKILDNILPKKETKEYTAEVKIEIDENNISIDKFQTDSKYIVKPSYVDKYNFITKDDILLEWNVSSNVEKIFINENELSNYKQWDSKFYYRLKETYWTIKEWENKYKIYFTENWNKVLKEEINFLFYSDRNILKKETTSFVRSLYVEEAIKEIPKEPEVVEIDKEELDKLSKLDENTYYDKELNPFTLRLYYLNSERELEQTAIFIQNSLKELWIELELIPIEISTISKILSNKEWYDMILTWVNLWYFDFNIFPYFHSSQVKNWYNFSNIKKTSLDILLEELKANIYNEEKTLQIQNKVISILKEEQVVKTLYTPKINLLVDKNIKNIDMIEILPNKSLRSYILNSSYIKEEKIINFEDKSILNFFKFLFKKLYE